jgi:hypothetical protein
MTTYMNQAKQVSNDELGSQMIAYGDEFEFSSDFGKSLSSMSPCSRECLSLANERIDVQWLEGHMSGWPANRDNLLTKQPLGG